MIKRTVITVLLLSVLVSLWAQTPIKSFEENYYDFLVLSGKAERTYQIYRNLSVNSYDNSEGFWPSSNLTKKNDNGVTVYGPDVLVTYNSMRPHGQNDGGLWQGRGINIQAIGGIGYKSGGFSFTLKPELDYSQNKTFTTIDDTNRYFNTYFPYDFPQRFGNDSFLNFDFGDSEIRFSTDCFTIGAGTGALWIGPMYLNAVLHSNNAGTYPRLDVGVNNLEIRIPWTNFKLGKIEAHYAFGVLRKSDYPDTRLTAGEKTSLQILTLSIKPEHLKHLTLGMTVVDHNALAFDSVGGFFYSLITFHNSTGQKNDEDMKWSFSFDLLFDEVGFDVYGEIGQDDYGQRIMNSYHTMVYQLGVKKTLDLIKGNGIYAKLVGEYGMMEMSRDAFTEWSYNFYTHGLTGSYSNMGQLLGAGTAYAGNSQYLALELYYKKGMTAFFAQRHCPDNNYILAKVNHKDTGQDYFYKFKGIVDIGVNTVFFATNDLSLKAGAVYEYIANDKFDKEYNESEYHYNGDTSWKGIYGLNNFHFELGLTCSF